MSGRAIYPGPKVPAEWAEGGTTHPALGELEPPAKRVAKGLPPYIEGDEAEIRSAIAAGLLAPYEEAAPAPKRRTTAERLEGAGTDKE